MDPLQQVLDAVRITSGVFLDAAFTAPWCITAQVTPEDCQAFDAPAGAVIAFHYVVEGALVMELEGQPPLAVAAGEIALLPRNDRHRLASAPGLPPVPGDDLIQLGAEGGLATIRHGGGGATTRIVCGFLACPVPDNPLVQGLPAALRIGFAEPATGAWVESSFRMAATELAAGRIASPALLARLAELLFAEAVRAYLRTLPEARSGWLAGLRDAHVGKALALLHARPAEPWTTEGLAREVALSRSAFADRFTRLLGQPPMRYLAAWRMQLAATRLREGEASVARIGFELGYDSEAAFNRAFKRHHGQPPATWRERELAGAP